MGRSAYCSKDADLKRGAWTAQEDFILREYITMHGDGGWRSLPQKAGLKRCGKSCRLRWLNYLRADINRGNISPDEEELIVRLHRLLGNRWSLIAGRLPGRTDNQIKNYWNIHLSKKQQAEKKTLPSSPTRSKPAPPVVHRDLKTNPVKATAVRVAKGCNKSESSSSSNHQGLESTVRIIVESQCNPNTTNGYSSSSSYDLVHNNNENEVVTSECLLHLKGMSSPEFDLLQSPQDLRFQKLEATSSNVMEQMRSLESSMPQGKTFTGWGKPYNETKVVDWIDELQSLHKSSMQWLSLLELDSENDW